MTDDVKERLKQHKLKESLYTLRFSEINLVYCEKYNEKREAAKREKQFKGWSHAKKQMLLDGILGRNRCTELVEELTG